MHVARCHGGVREGDVHLQLAAEGLNSSFQLASVEDCVKEGLGRPTFLDVIADRDGDSWGPRSPGAGELPGCTNPKRFHLHGQFTSMHAGQRAEASFSDSCSANKRLKLKTRLAMYYLRTKRPLKARALYRIPIWYMNTTNILLGLVSSLTISF